MSDLLSFILPDFSKCGDAAGNIGPAWGKAIEFLTTLQEESPDNVNTWSNEWWDVAGDPMLSVLTCCACGGCYIPGRTFEASIRETSCEGYCLGGWLTCCLQPCYYGAVRREMRNKYKIKGSGIEDLILSWCLGPCVLCQEAREVGLKEPPFTVPLTAVGGGSKPAAAPAPQEMGRDKEAAPAAAKPVPEEAAKKVEEAKPKAEETKPGM